MTATIYVEQANNVFAADTTGYNDVSGLKMYHEVTGTGDTVIFLHCS